MFKIVQVRFRGDIKNERVVLKATSDDDAGTLVLLRARRQGDDIYPGPALSFWFPDEKIERNSFVVLYSKEGLHSVRTNPSGTKTHFYYWDQASSVWGEDDSSVVVCEVNGWMYRNP